VVEPNFEFWDAEELIEEIREVADALQIAHDAEEFCLWLSDRWGIDTGV
jgi:hypothetical protein